VAILAPGLIVAAPASGQGKTTLALGLIAAFARAGVVVRSFKVGPDYIDPAFHEVASGRPCLNLDPWAMRGETLDALARALFADADLVIGEGVMGLYDGAADGTGSTADLAARLALPVLLVVDASRQGASVAALARGFASHRDDVTVAGVVLNRVGSAAHEAVLRKALMASGIAVLGALPRDEALALPERHLGLVQAREHAALDAFIARAAEAAARYVDLAAVRAIARVPRVVHVPNRLPAAPPSESSLDPTPLPSPQGGRGRRKPVSSLSEDARASDPRATPFLSPSPRVGEGGGGGSKETGLTSPPIPPLGSRIAIARDDAFAFLYPHLLDGWRQAGAALVFFSPLADEAPVNCDAVYLPGGYPELHAGRLAAATRFMAGLREAAARGAAIYGECGGYMTLGDGLIDADGARHAMAGLLPLATSFAARRLQLGYRGVELLADGPLGRKGTRFRGHEFHYATIVREDEGEALFEMTDATGASRGAAGRRRGRVFGSFAHLIDAAL
jgi:cobyrinic acid a,c-diamide synthase